jgi:hypothetical protein
MFGGNKRNYLANCLDFYPSLDERDKGRATPYPIPFQKEGDEITE